MKKLIVIGVVFVSVLLLMAFIYSSNSKSSMTKIIDENIEVSILPISSVDYAKLMNANREDYSLYDENYYYFLRLNEISGKRNPIFNELSSLDSFGERVNYLSNGISSDISLITGLDTLVCSMAHWERTYNARRDITIGLVFKRVNDEMPSKLIWNDQLVTGVPQKFTLD